MNAMVKRGLLKAIELIAVNVVSIGVIVAVYMLFGITGIIVLGALCYVAVIVHAAISGGK